MDKQKLTRDAIASNFEGIRAAETVFLAMLARDMVTPQVEAYQSEVLARHKWPPAEIYRNVSASQAITGTDEVILAPAHAFLLSDEHFAIYLRECEVARLALGLPVSKPGGCPAIDAREDLRAAEGLLIDTMKEATGLSCEVVDCAPAAVRKQLVDLLLRLFAPFVDQSPKILARVMNATGSEGAHAGG